MDPVEVGRRVAAARKRAGMNTREELSAKADIPRLGPKTVGKIERGERQLYAHEAPLLARALGVPVAYFYEDETETTQLDRVESLLKEQTLVLADTRQLLLAIAEGLKPQQPAEAPPGPPWAALDRLREELAARDREASRRAPHSQTSSTG